MSSPCLVAAGTPTPTHTHTYSTYIRVGKQDPKSEGEAKKKSSPFPYQKEKRVLWRDPRWPITPPLVVRSTTRRRRRGASDVPFPCYFRVDVPSFPPPPLLSVLMSLLCESPSLQLQVYHLYRIRIIFYWCYTHPTPSGTHYSSLFIHPTPVAHTKINTWKKQSKVDVRKPQQSPPNKKKNGGRSIAIDQQHGSCAGYFMAETDLVTPNWHGSDSIQRETHK